VCYWNLDHKVKLLVTKALSHANVRFLDVSPGGYSFEEMAEGAAFSEYVAYSPEKYYRRLDTLVLKYDGRHPAACRGKTIVIRNGVPRAARLKADYALRGAPRIVVNGRIAPTKFLLEIIDAVRLVREKFPDAQLHVFGSAEPQHRDYADEVARAGAELADGVRFHGTNFNVVEKLPDFDAYAVLGKHQGCSNALLEALSVGMPVVANDDGGTREQVIPGKTGLLIDGCSPQLLADALHKLLADRALAQKLGRAGYHHVHDSFSMNEMTERYIRLLEPQKYRATACVKT
jgi:glycosyltransferase involved in cell wall biosynthesis